jgi:hypothetical protein
MALLAVGALEFLLANLADALETDRHLFLFHVITDITLLFAATGALLWARGLRAEGSGRPKTLLC